MKRFRIAVLVSTVVTASAKAVTYTYTTIAPPGSTYTISIGTIAVVAARCFLVI
jgi:hypothetical protein